VSTPMSRNPKFDALIDEFKRVHSDKNHDYAEDGDPLSNLKACAAFGVDPFKGVLVRMSDKWSRLQQLTTGKTPKNESVRDSLKDLSIYAMLAILLLDEKKVGLIDQPTRHELSAVESSDEFNPFTHCGRCRQFRGHGHECVYVPDALGVPLNVP